MSMGMGESQGNSLDFDTARGRNWPTVTQYSVFLENRVGTLLELTRCFSGSKVKIVSLSIMDSTDCSIIRLLLNHPEQGREILQRNKFAFAESELLAVELPIGSQSLIDLTMALLQAEINIHYCYPLIIHPHGRAALVLHVDNVEMASAILHDKGFDILSEADLI